MVNQSGWSDHTYRACIVVVIPNNLSEPGSEPFSEPKNCPSPQLGADKLLFFHAGEMDYLDLPHWLPLSDAQMMLLDKLSVRVVTGGFCLVPGWTV